MWEISWILSWIISISKFWKDFKMCSNFKGGLVHRNAFVTTTFHWFINISGISFYCHDINWSPFMFRISFGNCSIFSVNYIKKFQFDIWYEFRFDQFKKNLKQKKNFDLAITVVNCIIFWKYFNKKQSKNEDFNTDNCHKNNM